MKKLLLSLAFMGAALAKAQYPLVSIDSVQYINPAKLGLVQFNTPGKDATLPDYVSPVFKNPVFGDTVTIEGVVAFDPINYGLSSTGSREAAFVQLPGGGPWSGVEVMYDSSASPVQQSVVQFRQNMKRGRTVKVTGKVTNFEGQTQLRVINVPSETVTLGPATITPDVIEVKDLMLNVNGVQTPQFATGEQWEGVYVELRNLTVIQDPNNVPDGLRFYWWVQDEDGNRLPVRDISGFYRNDNTDRDPNTPRNPLFNPPPTGSKIAYIRGVIVESGNNAFKQYNIAPLLISDVPPAIEPPSISSLYRTPQLARSANPVKISVDITDNGSVTGATLHYAVGFANPVYTPVTMTLTGGKYEASVPAQADGSVVKYYISATDNDNNTAFYPDSAGFNSAYKVVDNLNAISMLQETPFQNGASIFTNDTLDNIAVRGVVVSTINAYDLGLITLQDGNGPNSAILVRATVGDGINNWKRGDSILIKKGMITERIPLGSNPFGRPGVTGTTFIENIGLNGWEYVSRCNTLPGTTQVPFDSLVSTTFNKEPYESVLLEVNNVWVVQKNADSITGGNFGEFAVNPDVTATSGLRADDYSNDLYTNRVSDSLNFGGNVEKLVSFKGILVNTFNNWKFLPRNRTDMGKATDIIPPYMNLVGADTLFILVGSAINDPGAAACDDTDGDISTLVEADSSNVNVGAAGTYQITYKVEDNAGNAGNTLLRYVKVSSPVSIEENSLQMEVLIYPVPAVDQLHLAINANTTETATVTLVDVSGKTILSRNIVIESGKTAYSFDVAALKSGIYFCQISSRHLSKTEKITIVK